LSSPMFAAALSSTLSPYTTLFRSGADFLVTADAWHAKHAEPPQLMGQLFHLFESPNRFGLPPFYTLHVWAWKENPNGAFVNWNPDRKSTRLNSSHQIISYAVFCLK